MKKLRIRNKHGHLVCICGNTARHEGWEEDRSQRDLGVYWTTCLRCGVKFDDQTLLIIGLRLGVQNQRIREYLPRIIYQSQRHFSRRMQGILWPRKEAL
jgi:hypothetical protein